MLHERDGRGDEPRRFEAEVAEGVFPRAGGSAREVGERRTADVQGEKGKFRGKCATGDA